METRSRKSKKETIQWPKDKRTNNGVQNNTQKTKDRATQTPLSTGGELSSCSTSDTRRFTVDGDTILIHIFSLILGMNQCTHAMNLWTETFWNK